MPTPLCLALPQAGLSVLLVVAAILTPMGILMGLILARSAIKRRREDNKPIRDPLLRSPGHGLQSRLDALHDQLSESLMLALVIPTFAGCIFTLSTTDLGTGARLLGGFLLELVACVYFAMRIWRLMDERQILRLGLQGELAVGEEINQLMKRGCSVFHDFPLGNYGNIDHIVVAPTGVFAVETKTRHKKRTEAGKVEHRVRFDGKTLFYETGTHSEAASQAIRQAEQLQGFLRKAVGEPIPVIPLLAIPGWYVENTTNSFLKAVNPKQVGSIVFANPTEQLNSKLMAQVVHQIRQKCADVEF